MDVSVECLTSDQELQRTAQAALETGGDVDACLRLAVGLGHALPSPGDGYTRYLWETLAAIAAEDVTAARVVEPHLDALAILAQAASDDYAPEVDAPASSTWGVFAAEQPGTELTATHTSRGWMLNGTKPWCSLAGKLTHALVTAWLANGDRQLFAVTLDDRGITIPAHTWQATGLAAVTSGPVEFVQVPAVPVGAPGWYLKRSGFAWGGMGVAACWWGGASGVARTMLQRYAAKDPDQVGSLHVGAVDSALYAGQLALRHAAEAVDAGRATGDEGALLESRTRTIVAGSAETVIHHVAHALGPAPLALDAAHARRVADLSLYIRQHHGERDVAGQGRMVLDQVVSW
ncbi:acyl-CoA dehydrogenase [soil metagenome]